MSDFGDYLRSLREQQKMSLREVAAKTGVSVSYITQIENRRRKAPGPDVLKRLAPQKLSMHNLETMDIMNWESFEKKYGLRTIFKAYIGGFNPGSFRRCENQTLRNVMIRFFFKMVRILITDRFASLRRFNSIYWSAYLVGIYRKR